MRIGELSDRSGLSRDTIRFYERNGLLTSAPGQSKTNNYKDYPEDTLFKLAFYSKAREAGMSIADLRGIMDTLDGSCDPAVGKKVISEKIVELKERAEQIQSVVGFLEDAIKNA